MILCKGKRGPYLWVTFLDAVHQGEEVEVSPAQPVPHHELASALNHQLLKPLLRPEVFKSLVKDDQKRVFKLTENYKYVTNQVFG